MGLSGRKTKQRISDDPRNLCWADDAARFGSNYLAKFGWDGSKGLGVAGEGRTSHIKVSHKLDLLGIGAAQQKDPDGVAWKQNKDFERLLQRLNDASTTEKNQSGKEEGKINQMNPDTCVTEKKRKHREAGESKTERRKKRKGNGEGHSSSNADYDTIQPEKTVIEVKKAVMIPRHRAHRARAINAKNISSKSEAHISEILGIAPISSRSSSSLDSSELSKRSQGKPTSLTDEVEIGKITTSTKSVADYFKEKLNARSSSAIVSTSTTPRDSDDSYDTPRMGLGSRARLKNLTPAGEIETQKMGLSTFSAFSSSLVCEKTLDPDLENPPITLKMNANPNPQTEDLARQKKKGRKVKEEEMKKESSALEDKDETKEREERKRKRKLDKAKKDDSDHDLKFLKKQEKRKRKRICKPLLHLPKTSVDKE